MKRSEKKIIGTLSGIAGGYLMAIRPHRKITPLPGQIYYAHRGLHDNETQAPENSMAAFEKACEAGYGIELDVQLTKDEKVVVFHDFTLKRICSVEGQVSDYTYEELSRLSLCRTDQKIPLFSEVLTLVNGRVPLIVEIKCKGFDFDAKVCEKADQVLSGYRGNYCIESFHPTALRWYRKNRPQICRGQLSMNFQRQEGHYDPEFFVMKNLLTNFITRPDFIAYDVRDKEALSKNLCRKLFRCPSVAWTVKSERQLRQSKDYYDAFIFEGFRP